MARSTSTTDINGYGMSLIQQIEIEDRNRAQRIRNAWDAYRGTWEDVTHSADPGVDDNVKLNPARFLVNTGVHYLFGQKFEIEGDFDDKKQPQWKKDVDKLLLVNKQMRFFQKLAINGGVTGHAFVKILAKGGGPKKDMPRWIVLDPGTVTVETDDHDLETVLNYTITYETVDKPYADGSLARVIVHQESYDYNEVTNHWDIVIRERYDDENAWRTISTAEWPFAWAPIVDCQNLVVPNDFWGLPDLEKDVIDICRTIQRIASHCAKIVRIYGSPRVVVEGMTSDEADEIDVSEENIVTLPNPDATMKVLTFTPDLTASLNTLKMTYEGLREMTQVPEIATGQTEHATRASSGIQMSMMFAPIVVKTESKQLSYGDLILELLRRSMVLMDTDLPKGVDDPWEIMDMYIQWPEVMPGAAFLERQTLTVDQQLGASMDTVLTKLGYDPEVEKTNIIAWLKEVIKEVPELVDTKTLATNMMPVPTPPLPQARMSGVAPTGSMGGAKSAGVAKGSGKQQGQGPGQQGGNAITNAANAAPK